MLSKLAAISQSKISPNLRKILSNISWLFADKILRVVTNSIIWVWIARYLGPEKFGTYNYALSFIALFEVLSALGLRGIAVKDIINEPDKKHEILGTTFVLKLIGGICIVVISTTIISLTKPDNTLIFWLVAIFALTKIFAAFSNIAIWFQSKVKSKFTIYASGTAFIIGTIAKIVLILGGAPLLAFAWIFLLEIIIGKIGLIASYQTNGESIKAWRFNFTRAKKMLNQAWPLILAGVGTALYLKIDQVMLGEISGVKEVGIYAAAVRFSEVTYFIPTIITASVFPSLIKSKADDNESYQNKLQKLYNWMTWISITLAVFGLILAQPVINLFYGQEYQQAGIILSIHVWSSLFIFWHQINMDWLVNEGLLKFPLIRQSIGAIVNVSLNWLLIPKYGGIGAAIATVISYGIASYIVFYLTPKTRVAAGMMTSSLVFPVRVILKKFGVTS